MSIGEVRRSIQKIRGCAAFWVSITTLHTVRAGSRMLDAFFPIGSMKLALRELALVLRPDRTRTRPQLENGPIALLTARCTPTLLKNLLNMASLPVPTWRR